MIENHSWFGTRRLAMPSKFLLAWLYSGKLIVRKWLSYLNKQNVCISYEDISRHNRKWEAAVLVGESRTTTLLKQLTAALITSMLKQNLYSFILLIQIFSNPIRLLRLLFRWFKSVEILETFSSRTAEEIAPLSIVKLRGPKPFPNFEDNNLSQLLEKRFSMVILWAVAGGTPQTEEDQLPLVSSSTLFNKQVSSADKRKSLIKYMPVILQSVSDYSVLKAYLLIFGWHDWKFGNAAYFQPLWQSCILKVPPCNLGSWRSILKDYPNYGRMY